MDWSSNAWVCLTTGVGRPLKLKDGHVDQLRDERQFTLSASVAKRACQLDKFAVLVLPHI